MTSPAAARAPWPMEPVPARPSTFPSPSPAGPSGQPAATSPGATGDPTATVPATPGDPTATPTGTPGDTTATPTGTPGGSQSPGEPATAVPAASVAALQAALAGEHAAVWASGRAAAVLLAATRTAALVELDEHRAARDQLRRLIAAQRATPVEAAPAYVEPFPVRGPKSARRLMGHVNERLAATYADLAAALEPAARAEAIDAATEAAVRAIEWGAPAAAFPGEGS